MIESNLSRINRILEKLEQVRERGLSCFGSESHHFQLFHPIAEEELRAFEAQHGIHLPDDYRTFLLHAGNGGAGPYYGIYPLKKWGDFIDWVLEERQEDEQVNLLALSCPLHPDLAREKDWREKLDCVSPYQGTLSLGTQGCTYAMQLVVSGPYAGRVVYVEADDLPPYMVHEPDFLTWYERWLDELLQGYEIHWFGFGPGGGEENFFNILDDPEANDDYRAEAAYAFCHLPSLSDSASGRISLYLDDASEGVRAGTIATIRKFNLRSLTDAVSRLLVDPSPDIRKQVVQTVLELDPQGQIDAVLHRLKVEPDEGIAGSAFYKLKDIGALSKSEVLQTIKKMPSSHLQDLAINHATWAQADAMHLYMMLLNPSSQIRLQAILAFQEIEVQNWLEQILKRLAGETDVNVVDNVLKMLGKLKDPISAPFLLKWATDGDDFQRLDAVDALAKIGDERAYPIVLSMLRETRKPSRQSTNGVSEQSGTHAICDLVRKSVKASPNKLLRKLS